MRMHVLRHNEATIPLALGVEMKVISEILGHASISITADFYTHAKLDTAQEAADRFNVLFK